MTFCLNHPRRRCLIVALLACLFAGVLSRPVILSGAVERGSLTGAGISSTIEAFTEPMETILVAAPETGIISERHVAVGDAVQAGTLLVTLDNSVLLAEREIAAARADSTAAIDAAAAQLQLEQSRLNKLLLLSRQGAGSAEELARSESEVRVKTANLQAARDEQLFHQLQLKRIDAQIERRKIRSSISGIVLRLEKKIGEYVAATEPNVAEVVNIDKLRARFHVPTAIALQIVRGNELKISVPAITSSGTIASSGAIANSGSRADGTRDSKLVTGRVEYVAPVTSADSGTVRIDIVMDNPGHRIRSGIRCLLHTGQLQTHVANHPRHKRRAAALGRPLR